MASDNPAGRGCSWPPHFPARRVNTTALWWFCLFSYELSCGICPIPAPRQEGKWAVLEDSYFFTDHGYV